MTMKTMSSMCRSRLVSVLAAVALLPTAAAAASGQTSGSFKGNKVNHGTVTHSLRGGQSVLTLSEDFKVPESSDPHWRVVDSHRTGYLLQRVVVMQDKVNRMIVVPQYVKDVAKVQIWDASSETLLGEASFGSPVAMQYNPASARAIVNEGLAYDNSRMRPRDEADLGGTGFPLLEYDESTMRPAEK
jgi:hypothetical protein